VAVEAMRRGARDFVQKHGKILGCWLILRTQIDLRRRYGRHLVLKPKTASCAPNRAQHFWRNPRRWPGAGADWTNRTFGRKRFDHRRAWHRQEVVRANSSCVVGAGDEANGDRECGRAIRRYFRSELFGHVKGAFTDARADRVGRFELARRKHVVSGRNRQRPAQPAGENSCAFWKRGISSASARLPLGASM